MYVSGLLGKVHPFVLHWVFFFRKEHPFCWYFKLQKKVMLGFSGQVKLASRWRIFLHDPSCTAEERQTANQDAEARQPTNRNRRAEQAEQMRNWSWTTFVYTNRRFVFAIRISKRLGPTKCALDFPRQAWYTGFAALTKPHFRRDMGVRNTAAYTSTYPCLSAATIWRAYLFVPFSLWRSLRRKFQPPYCRDLSPASAILVSISYYIFAIVP
jgi:hypothetical protein